MTLKLGMQHQVLEYYQVCSNDDSGLTLTYCSARSNLLPYAFVRIMVKHVYSSVDIKILSPGAICPLPPGYIHVLNHEKNCIKSDFKETPLKLEINR